MNLTQLGNLMENKHSINHLYICYLFTCMNICLVTNHLQCHPRLWPNGCAIWSQTVPLCICLNGIFEVISPYFSKLCSTIKSGDCVVLAHISGSFEDYGDKKAQTVKINSVPNCK